MRWWSKGKFDASTAIPDYRDLLLTFIMRVAKQGLPSVWAYNMTHVDDCVLYQVLRTILGQRVYQPVQYRSRWPQDAQSEPCVQEGLVIDILFLPLCAL